jgi:hypothetical protein
MLGTMDNKYNVSDVGNSVGVEETPNSLDVPCAIV